MMRQISSLIFVEVATAILFVSLLGSSAEAGTKAGPQNRQQTVQMCPSPPGGERDKDLVCKRITPEEACLLLEDRCWVGDFVGQEELRASRHRLEAEGSRVPAKFFHFVAGADAPRATQ